MPINPDKPAFSVRLKDFPELWGWVFFGRRINETKLKELMEFANRLYKEGRKRHVV